MSPPAHAACWCREGRRGSPRAVTIEVDDTLVALQELGRHMRRLSGASVVAITGSAGKTSTKEAAAEFLARRHTVYRNVGNLNNHIGLPLTLLELRSRPDVAVVELGMNHAGEISRLVELAEPDVRVWTNVGDAHVGHFASIEAIADAKAEVLERASEATRAVVNGDDPRVMARMKGFVGHVTTFGLGGHTTIRAVDVRDRGVQGTTARLVTPAGDADVSVPIPGRGPLMNVLAATGVALGYDVPLREIVEHRGHPDGRVEARRGHATGPRRRAGGRLVQLEPLGPGPGARRRGIGHRCRAPRRRHRRDARARRVCDRAAPRIRPPRRRGRCEPADCHWRIRRRSAGGSGRRRRPRRRRRPALRDQRRGSSPGRGDAPRRRRRAGEGVARHAHRHRRGPREGGVGLMLYHLLFPLHTEFSVLNVTRYITFRTAAASLTALAISLLLGPWLIRKLREFQIGQVIRQEGPATHRTKAGTPTMGGLLILAASLVPTLLWADLTNIYIWIAVLATAGFGAVGFADDYLKLTRRNHHGLIPRYKMGGQLLVALGVGLSLMALAHYNLYSTRLIFPFFKGLIPDLGWLYVPFAVLVLVSVTNAVNLTDGLDGLAISTFAIVAAAFTALAYVTGHRILADYLLLVRFAPAGELTIFCGALVGASLGFLWYNSYPAEIFMGDVGSLGLGGALGTVAILIKQELLLVIVGGVFVLEALSVIVQVASFKLTGKRVFRMAPLHHHFELTGWSEPKVITRFVILGIIFALLSLTTLKLR